MHLFERQQTEDGPDLANSFVPDRTTPDLVDPDNENHLPIPLAVPGGSPGKTRARSSTKDWSDDDSEIGSAHV